MRHPFRRKALQPRVIPLYGLALFLLWQARPSTLGWLAGGSLVLAGELLRLWAAGHLVKTERLTVSGPYAHVRNPLYVGSLTIAVGFALMAGGWAAWAALAAALPVFTLHYLPYKERIESARLERRYGEAYRAYRAAVPAFVPRLRAWEGGRGNPAVCWSLERVRENDELGTLLGVVCGVVALMLRDWLLG